MGIFEALAGRSLLREAGKSLPPGEDPGVSPKATDGVWKAGMRRRKSTAPICAIVPTEQELAIPHPAP